MVGEKTNAWLLSNLINFVLILVIMKWLKRIAIFLVILLLIYLVGPTPSTPVYKTDVAGMPTTATTLVAYIAAKEQAHQLKPNNEARIVWANDSLQQMTEYAIVYLHGFSASQEEGNPTHRTIASKFGCNLYLARLAEHGIDTVDQLIRLTPDNYWESAVEALTIGRRLGKKVILMGTSTGGTQALQLAAAFPDDVAGLILYSPNIEINDPNAGLLNNPWGLHIARLVKQSKFNNPPDERPIYQQYWNKPYRLEAIVALQEMLETTMTEKTFSAVKQPTLALYYYKNEKEQDPVVKVSAIQKMMSQLGTAAAQKRHKALPNTGDHVIASPIKSKDVQSVIAETAKFLEEVMGLKKKTAL
jgi:esterase/lipase